MGLFILLTSLGIGLLLFGVSIRIGKIKNWWLTQFNPVVPEAGAYISIPIGIILIIWGLAALSNDVDLWGTVLDYTGILFIVAIIIIIWRPRWLLPRWLRWLEDNHNDILPLLKREAQIIGSREWGKRIETQEGLEEWVAEVRRKHKV